MITTMVEKKILVVEDELPFRKMLRQALERADYHVYEAGDAKDALSMIADESPDLILLDWMLPGMSGIELARRLKKESYSREIPIIMLTARVEEDDRIHGLEAGADDYVTKPFSPRELLARIKAVLRRTLPEGDDGVMIAGDITMDVNSHRVVVAGEKLEMGPTEFRLLHFFMSHIDRVYSRTQLLDRVWSQGSFLEERTVDVHIRRLRKVLEAYNCDHYVQTVRGSGYRFSLT